MKTAEQWLEIELHDAGPDYKGGPQFTCIKCKQTYPTHETSRCPASDLAIELGRVFTPEPWKHCGMNIVPGICNRCGNKYSPATSCTIPNPIKIDWNTTMEWRDNTVKAFGRDVWLNALREVIAEDEEQTSCLFAGCLVSAQPKHYLIAAAMVVEGAKT